MPKTYTNSPLTNITKLAPLSNGYGARTEDIIFFTPHCYVGQVTAERIANTFYPKSRKASCNYGIGLDGRIALIVEEKNAAGTSNSRWNDERAITIECASDSTKPWAFKDVVYKKLVALLVDVCQRNGKTKVLYFGTLAKTKDYLNKRKDNEMILTEHRMFAAKACPGDWMHARMQKLADDANKILQKQPTPTPTPPTPTPTEDLYRVRLTWDDKDSQKGAFKDYDNAKKCADANPGYSVFNSKGECLYTSPKKEKFKVRVTINDLNIRAGAGTNYPVVGVTGKGVFTIVETSPGQGSVKGWGKLLSGKGWISLDYCTRL